jgi:WD40 repeat protein
MSAVRALAVITHPDGGVTLAWAGDGPMIRLSDPIARTQIRQFGARDGNVTALAVLRGEHERRVLAAAGDDGTIRLWDPETGTQIRQLAQAVDRPAAMTALTGMPGPGLLAWANRDGAWLWRLGDEGGRRRWADVGQVAIVAWSGPLGMSVASGGSDGVVRVSNPASDGPGRNLRTHMRPVSALCQFSGPDGDDLLAVGGSTGELQFWDPTTGARLRDLSGHNSWISALATVPRPGESSLLASAGDGGEIRLWDSDTGSLVGELSGHTGPVSDLAVLWIADRHDPEVLLVSCGRDGAINLWNIATGGQEQELDTPQRLAPRLDRGRSTATVNRPLREVRGHVGAVWALTAVKRSDGTPLLASGGDDGTVKLWAPDKMRPYREFVGSGPPVRALVTVPRSDRTDLLVSAGDDCAVRLWRPEGGSPLTPEMTHAAPVRALAVLRRYDDTVLVSGDEGGVIRLWHPDTGEIIRELETKHGIRALTELPSYEHLACADDNGRIHLWHPVEGFTRQWTAHRGAAVALTVIQRHDGSVVLVSAGDEALRFWDLNLNTMIGEIAGGYSALCNVTRHGRDELLATAEAQWIRFWYSESGKLARDLGGQQGAVHALSALTEPGGTSLLASGGDDGVIRLWDVGTEHTVGFRGLSDRPASVDQLGRDTVVAVLCDLLGGNARAADDGPMVIGVEGRWGTGKTSVLQLVESRLSRVDQAGRRPPSNRSPYRLRVGRASRALSTGRPPFLRPTRQVLDQVTAWFNPWAYQSPDQVWAGLVRTIQTSVEAALYGTDRVGTPNLHDRPTADRALAEDAPSRHRDAKETYWFTRNLARVDRRDLHQQLWRRARSPLLTFGVVALLGPLVIAVATRTSTVAVAGHHVPSGLLASLIPAMLLVLGVLHTAARAVFARASAFLPGVIFQGPVLSGPFGQQDTAREGGIRDPYYNSRSGLLYLIQHDVVRMLKDLQDSGSQLILFIDDLDRCTPETTAQVFQAINLFLSHSLGGARFILGLDPEVVATHIDHTFPDLAAAAPRHPGDPSAGWTFLRKLIQLPVALPQITSEGIDRLLNATLGPPSTPPTTPTGSEPQPKVTGADEAQRATAASVNPNLAAPTGDGDRRPADISAKLTTDLLTAEALECQLQVRRRLRERLIEQPEQSARETKRLLTVWQFYVRLLQEIDPIAGEGAVQRAEHLVVVAEIITRWPAQQRPLRSKIRVEGPAPDRQALTALAAVAKEDLAWSATLSQIQMPSAEEIGADLRQLLTRYDGAAIARLYEQIT